MDGSFDIYKLDIEDVLKIKVNKNNTFEDCQRSGKRPRFSVREKLIVKQGLRPIFSSNIGINKKYPKISGKLNLSKRLFCNKKAVVL